LGKVRRLQQCADDGGRFTMLAADQRGNLRRALHPDDPESTTAEELTEFKVELVRSLSSDVSAVLLDPEFGAAQAIDAGALSGGSGLIVALEQTGYAKSPYDRKSEMLVGWTPAKAEALGASAAKLLVYFHPDAPGAQGQIDLIAEMSEACEEVDLPLIVEPLSFPLTNEPLTSEDKRDVVVETARILGAIHGVDLLKMEFPATPDDEPTWAAACAELDSASPVPWVILSAGVDFDTFVMQATAACRAGASGVLAGRAVWKESVDLAPDKRRGFYKSISSARLAELTKVVESHAKPWRELSTSAIRSDWYV
jgi:tagatose 1,6-diphosphate aldolase